MDTILQKSYKTKPQLTIKELQRKLREKEQQLRIKFVSLTKREKDILLKTVKLSEEVGELSNDILSVLSLQRKSKLDAFDKTNLYEEFADVVLGALALANTMRVDMDRAVKDKLKKIFDVYAQDK
ncbi:MAG TPA: MazG nucleotide pyrophosphohydrolase domain-containing protein [Patescibacteria group bacterium]|nr:MazG nucleotide pyrophosphohydrolase domain-containing protein [Patescibacteria group bacterium]